MGLTAATVARVVPDLPTFAVDDGFAYRVPGGMSLEVGSIVRVPLGGRRVRGYVVGLGEPEREGLREVLGRSGDLAVFTPRMLRVLRWAAMRYVAPLSSLLSKAAPPNLPRHAGAEPVSPVAASSGAPSLGEVVQAAVDGRRSRTHYWLGRGPWAEPLGSLLAPVVAANRSAIVVAASVAEAGTLADHLGQALGDRVMVASSSHPAADVTRAWVAASTAPGTVVVGTREIAFWPLQQAGLAVIVEDGRRAMKDRATPTTHARDVLWQRSGVERFSLVLCGAVPTTEALHRSPALVEEVPGTRLWGSIEVVDRRDDPPGSGIVSQRALRALDAVVRRGGRAFVFTHRRAAAVRCVACRSLRTCVQCGARPDRDPVCARCGTPLGGCTECGGQRFEPLGASVSRITADVVRAVGRDAVGSPGSGARVIVGTERDLVGATEVDLAVVVDADGLLRAPHYRAVEDAVRLLARVARLAGPGSGRRCMVQTADPGHPGIGALRRGSALEFLAEQILARDGAGLPPSGEVVAIEVEAAPTDADAALRAAVGERGAVLGPADQDGRLRWLVQGRDLQAARIALRSVVRGWREAGARVRVDADPIDL